MNIKLAFWALVIAILAAWAARSEAAETFKVKELSLSVGRYTSDKARDAYLQTPTTGALAGKLDLTWDINLVCGYYPKICWYWDNTIHSKTGQNRFRHVGWEFENGLDFGWLQIYYYHYSQHMMEQLPEIYARQQREMNYPVEDTVMIKFNFIRKGR